jgi:hypothetical protein
MPFGAPNALADAAFIVIACNMHDELVAALTIVKACIDDAGSILADGPAMRVVHAALAKVRP